MATAESVKAKIQGLINTANTTTGNSDTDLTTAVNALVAGFGSGGSGGDGELVKSIVESTAVNLSLGENVIKIGQYKFYGMTTLEGFDFTYITSIGAYAFSGCTNLGGALVLNGLTASGLGGRAFMNCSSITSVKSDTWTTIYSSSPNIFQNCTSLTDVDFPALTSVGLRTFSGCSALAELDLPSAKSISTYAFENCSALNTLILRKIDTVVTLSGVTAFNGTPFASGGTGGTVYVPQALIESYQTATNWSTLYAAGTCNFVAIEGSEYE